MNFQDSKTPAVFAALDFSKVTIISSRRDSPYWAGRKGDICVSTESVEAYFDDKESGRRYVVKINVTVEHKDGATRKHPRHKHVALRIAECLGYSAEENRWGTEGYKENSWSALMGSGYEDECPVSYAAAFDFAAQLKALAESGKYKQYQGGGTYYRRAA